MKIIRHRFITSLTNMCVMDKWKYYAITHQRHLVCNPISVEKLERLCQLLKPKKGERVLDIACGKGELLVRLAELYGVSGVGVDISPYCIQECIEKHQNRVSSAKLKFVEMDGAEFMLKNNELFDLTMCIGASWIFNGYKGTLKALKEATKSDGLIVIGEPFWQKEPCEEDLKTEDIKKDDYGTHLDNVRLGEDQGLSCLYTIVANEDDWDHYESLQWWATDDFARNHPEDPDTPELLKRITREKEAYLKWRRETLGWAIYVFRKPR